MKIFLFAVCGTIVLSVSFGQPYTPVSVTGFNEDVIAEGTGRSSLATTSREMDAIDPSNFVLCTEQFARANGQAWGYGIPDNGKVQTAQQAYSLAPYGEKNALYLLRHQSGTLTLRQPKNYTAVSVLGLATEGNARLAITATFSDGSELDFKDRVFPDWFDGPQAVLSGFGRVKRGNGSGANPLYFEGVPSNPRMYAFSLALPPEKTLISITFLNTTENVNIQSNRAFIFAIAGHVAPPPPPVQKVVEEKVIPVPEKVPGEKKITIVEEKKPPIEEKKVALVPLRGITIQGTVTDVKTGKPVQASLRFAGNKALSVSSDAKGTYSVDFPDSAQYTVKIEATGYIGILDNINVKTSPRTGVNFKLAPIEVGTHVNLRNVLFELGSAKLQESSFGELNMVVDFLKNNASVSIELAGHTDNRGSRSLNLELSNNRVNEVKKYLVQKGIDGSRITGKGYGGSKPIAQGNTEEAHKLNRRVEFIITGTGS